MVEYKSGKTPLIKIEEFCKKFNLPNLLVKDESKNPFGTWKDRRSELIVRMAQENSVDKLCLITAGNAGFSLAKFAQTADINVVAVVDKNSPDSIKSILKKECYGLAEVDLSRKMLASQELIALARESDKEIIWDVTNGFEKAYELIIQETKDFDPNYIICPVGSSEALVGLHEGIRKYDLKATLIGVRPKSNPSFADKLSTSWLSYEEKMDSILREGDTVVELTEEEIKSAYSYAKNYIVCEPSSAVVLGVFDKVNFKESDKIILINSGKGLV